ncbi:MAG TPA: hypothetical protein PK339_13190 [Flavitalea sp.]|nr:hypothetical protein [Flavitalea sp.]
MKHINNQSGNENETDKIWAVLMHLSFNFASGIVRWGGIRKEFEPDQSLWDAAIHKMAEQGVNMVVINLDDSIAWSSHPEIALKNAWTPKRLREELAKIRKLGIEPIPMLNFSATHDAWLGEYAKMVSTKDYYKVCGNLINEAIDLFGAPRFFHFGMDEETIAHQQRFDRIIMRQNDLWWGDLYFYISQAIRRRARPWVWSDYIWHHPDLFLKMMPKSVVQSNWYYGEEFDLNKLEDSRKRQVQAYVDLEAHGYDQIPTGSNDGIFYSPRPNTRSFSNTVEFCSKHISDKRLKGFLQTLWAPTIEKYRPNIMEGIELVGAARKKYEQENGK